MSLSRCARSLILRGGAVALGRRVGRLPMSYLGLSLGAPFKSQAAWNVVQDHLNRRLVSWEKKRENCLKAQGAGFTLIKSALSNLSIYYM